MHPSRRATMMEMHVRLAQTRRIVARHRPAQRCPTPGAYGEHGPTTVGQSGHKSIPLYRKAEAFRFTSDVVYTNHNVGGQRTVATVQHRALFAVESAVNELANILGNGPVQNS